ncbi:MAG: TerB family tellurite resistance protein [Bacteroidetes bacterium]|nr:TerB family tellurite resistance protein [Bacteroidota bacterium]MBI3483323.1 TerB family tellurite resistance protein [Bacteroidota bacterium]
MDYHLTISGLYYLLICADGNVNEKELLLGKKMVVAEGFDEAKFLTTLDQFKNQDKILLYKECVGGLKKLKRADQIRCVAWMCVIANSDGFMDKEEWVLIYRIYHDELDLSLDEIMKTQKQLNKILHGKEFLSFGVKVTK